jgi:hypothetical protein
MDGLLALALVMAVVRSGSEDPARPAGAATPANHSTEIYLLTRSAAAVAMYFE